MRLSEKKNIDLLIQFERNYKECKRLGIPVGVYHYSYAKTEGQAKREAEGFVVNE